MTFAERDAKNVQTNDGGTVVDATYTTNTGRVRREHITVGGLEGVRETATKKIIIKTRPARTARRRIS